MLKKYALATVLHKFRTIHAQLQENEGLNKINHYLKDQANLVRSPENAYSSWARAIIPKNNKPLTGFVNNTRSIKGPIIKPPGIPIHIQVAILQKYYLVTISLTDGIEWKFEWRVIDGARIAQLGIIVIVGHMIDDHVPAPVVCIQVIDDLDGEVAFDCRAGFVDVVIVYVVDVALYICG